MHREQGCTVTLMDRTALPAPLNVGGRTILDVDAPVVWFTFPDRWYDVGRFHTAAGEFTGCYANILTPVRFLSPCEWQTTDLFLDVWRDAQGTVSLLDEEELQEALERAWLTPELAARARAEARDILGAARAGTWPPAIVEDWPLERARAHADGGTRGGTAV